MNSPEFPKPHERSVRHRASRQNGKAEDQLPDQHLQGGCTLIEMSDVRLATKRLRSRDSIATQALQKTQLWLINKLPAHGTKAAYEYLESLKQIDRFFAFVIRLAAHNDHAAQVAHEALVKIEDDEQKRTELIAEWQKRRSAIAELGENRQFLLEVILVRHVENFLNYLAALLFDIFTQRPETLRSGDQVDVASILKHDSIDSVVREIAERKVESLSYSSFSDLSLFFKDRFGVPVGSDTQRRQVAEAIEIRNISVHNRCIKNKRFVSRLSRPASELGKQHHLDINQLEELVPIFLDIVATVDKAVRKKLKLRGVRFTNINRLSKHLTQPKTTVHEPAVTPPA